MTSASSSSTRRPSPLGSANSRGGRRWRTLTLLLLGLSLLGLVLSARGASASPSPPSPLPASSGLNASWSNSGTNAPPISNASALLYPDTSSPFPLLFGGSGYCNATYCNETLAYLYYEGTPAWEDLSPSHSPSPRAHASLAWDPTLQVALLFGGLGPHGYLNDTWTYALTSGWSQLKLPISPSARAGASLAFDPVLNETILFGGIGPHGPLNDTWAFADGSWTRLDPAEAPPPRSGALFVTGPSPGDPLLFGGLGLGGYLNDTWTFQGSTWERLSPARSPSPRANAQATTTAGGYPLLFGGEGPAGFLNDTWVWKDGTWSAVTNLPAVPPGPTPSPVADGILVPDTEVGSNFFVLFGGYASTGIQDEQWTLFAPFGGLPPSAHPLTVVLLVSPQQGSVPLAVTFTAEVTGGEAPYQYSWSFGDGSQAAGSATEVHHYTATGSYVATVTVTDAQGTTTEAAVELTVHPVPFDPFSVLGGPVVWGLLVVVGLLVAWGVRGGSRELRERRRIRAGVGRAPTRGELTAQAIGGWARRGGTHELVRELRRIWLPTLGRTGGRGVSAFWTWLARRSLLMVAQLLLGITLLFLFTVFVNPSLGTPTTGTAFLSGWSTFVVQLLTGQWGQVLLVSNVFVPVGVVVGYYLPYSLELAAFSLLFTALIAYPLGILSGWRRGGGVDNATRLFATFGAFFSLVTLALYVTDFLYAPYVHTFGTPFFGSLPSGVWFAQHYGGYPPWIGTFGQTSPTGFPLVDAVVHQAWDVEGLIWLNLLVQSALIGLIYAALYLRYARLATLGVRNRLTTSSARARGLTERALLWRHTSRQVLPIYIYTFGNTFALFLLIQSIAEWFFQDTGMGSFLITEVFNPKTVLGSAPPLLAVLAFLILLVIMVVNLTADAVSRWLDPRLGWEGRRR